MIIRKIVQFFSGGVIAALLLASLFQYARTCYGRECMSEFLREGGTYVFPGKFCFQVSEFYFPSKYEIFPVLSRYYFYLEYIFLIRRPRLIIYQVSSDRYLVLKEFNYDKSVTIDVESCKEDLAVKL
jgi:hypothetical protein